MKKKLLYIVLICISLNTFASPKKNLYDRILEKNDSFWILEKCLKILHTENKESIKKYFANIETLTFYHELEEKTIQWDEQDCFSTFCIIKDLYRDQDNLCVTWGKELDLLSFYMNKINYENGCFYINVVKTFNCKKNENKLPFSSWPIQEDECTIILRFDGDYLEVYLNNLTDYYDTFCKVDNETLNQYNNLIQTNKCDLSRVTWPRRADGSSDYETINKLQQGKRYRASDNLRLRSSGSTAGGAGRNDRQGHASKSAEHRRTTNYRRYYKQLGASGSAGGRKRQGRESYSYWDNGLVLWRVLEVGALYFAYHLNNAECLSSIRIRK